MPIKPGDEVYIIRANHTIVRAVVRQITKIGTIEFEIKEKDWEGVYELPLPIHSVPPFVTYKILTKAQMFAYRLQKERKHQRRGVR